MQTGTKMKPRTRQSRRDCAFTCVFESLELRQLLSGSGLALAAARVLALAPWEVRATLPASNAAASFHSSGKPSENAL